MHRDSLLARDSVNSENFAQHAEHYTRLLAEAQKEIDAKREEQEQQNRERQIERDRERNERLKAQEEAAREALEGEAAVKAQEEHQKACKEETARRPSARPRACAYARPGRVCLHQAACRPGN